MTSWEQGKFLDWDATYVRTCIDTFCQSNVRRAANEAGGAAAYAEEMKERKYSHLGNMYFFKPIAVETCGSIGPSSMAFLKRVGKCLKMVTGEPRSFAYLLQRISVAVQVGNTVSITATIPVTAHCDFDF